MRDLEIEDGKSYKELLQLYQDNFSLGNLAADFKTKMALISLICHITQQLRQKKPDITHYQVIIKMAEGKSLPYSFLKALAVICDEFSYGCDEFPTFDLKGQEIIKTIKNILGKYLPF